MVEVIVVIGVLILVGAQVSARYGLNRSLVLMALGAGAAFLPAMRHVQVAPEAILSVFLPLLLGVSGVSRTPGGCRALPHRR